MSRPLPSERCNRCRFWIEDMAHRDPNDADWGFGSCRRRPPVLVESVIAKTMPPLLYGQQTDPEMDALDLHAASRFPATASTDWCGEYEREGGKVPL